LAWRDREGWKVLQRVDAIFAADPLNERYDRELGSAALRLGRTGDEKLILWVRTLCQRFHGRLLDPGSVDPDSFLAAFRGLACLGAREEAVRSVRLLTARNTRLLPVLATAAAWEERVPSRQVLLEEVASALVRGFSVLKAEGMLSRWLQVERGGLWGSFRGKGTLLAETVGAMESCFQDASGPKLRRLERWCLPLPVTVPISWRYRAPALVNQEAGEVIRRISRGSGGGRTA